MTSDDPADLLRMMPFAAELGIELVAASADESVGRLEWAPQLCTAGGLMHGGALMTFADSVGAVCAFLNLPKGSTTATTNSITHFFRGVREGAVTGRSRALHVGRSAIVVRTTVTDDAGRLVAETTQTQAILGPG
jgi:uncharacterized protein (TIGR00369 family)